MATTDIVKDDVNGLEKLVLKSEAGATAELYLHGAHVTSWKDASGRDVLFTSGKALFAPPKAIRGGVPVCFPQFGMLGPLGQHGFARNTAFTVEARPNSASATLLLVATGEEDEKYPHAFELRVRVELVGGDTLLQELRVTNTGEEEMAFTCALHTYYRVDDIGAVAVEGLGGVTYTDSLAGGARVEQAGDVGFDREVDRIYLAAPDTGMRIVDRASGAAVEVRKTSFPDAVVWNPWVDKSRAMADFGDDEYKVMLCIEPAVAGSGPVKLAPGATWSGTQTLVATSPAAKEGA